MFSIQEIEMLMQGLDAIEKAASMSDAMGDLMVGILARGEDERRKLEDDRAERQQKKAAVFRMRKMQINILKGKLAQIALDVQSETLFNSVSTT